MTCSKCDKSLAALTALAASYVLLHMQQATASVLAATCSKSLVALLVAAHAASTVSALAASAASHLLTAASATLSAQWRGRIIHKETIEKKWGG